MSKYIVFSLNYVFNLFFSSCPYRQSVCMRVRAMLPVCVLKDGWVMAECVWKLTTVSWKVEAAAAPKQTVITSDLDR